jgi:hypothetical protein
MCAEWFAHPRLHYHPKPWLHETAHLRDTMPFYILLLSSQQAGIHEDQGTGCFVLIGGTWSHHRSSDNTKSQLNE